MSKKGKRIDAYVPDYVVFDLETTGTSTRKDKIIEISALKVRGGKVVDEFSTLVNPECEIPFYASQVNHITDDMVEDAPVIEEVLPEFLEFVGDSVLLGQNIQRFDMEFIYRECRDKGLPDLENGIVDTLPLGRTCLPQMHNHKLSDMAEYFGISTEGAHRALADCYMTYHVYEKLGPLIEEAMKSVPKCKKCGRNMVRRKGKYGEFWGCSGYPECTYTRDV